MRALLPIERAALLATAKDNPAIAAAILWQAKCAFVTKFENTGAGFFSTLEIVGDAPKLAAHSRLDGAHGKVMGVEHGMGFIVFLESGRINLLEGYVNGVVPTKAVDFSEVGFELWPLCEAEE